MSGWMNRCLFAFDALGFLKVHGMVCVLGLHFRVECTYPRKEYRE